MDAKFQASFIPKQPIAPRPVVNQGRVSLFYIIALIIFIIAIGLLGAVLIAERVLNRDIENLNAEVVKEKSAFELSTIDEMKRTSARIKVANQLIDKHRALSKFMEVLEQSTYANVSFTDFSAEEDPDTGKLAIDLKGAAQSFNTLTLQSERFEELMFEGKPLLTNKEFSDFKLDEDGYIVFTFRAVLDPSIVTYKKYITE